MIEVNNISKTIKGETILVGISLKLYEGRVYGFQGRNGSGKTMLFRAIGGLIGVDSGEVIVNGLKLDNRYFAQDLGLLLENPSFLPYISGKKNLQIIAALRNKINESRIDEVLKLVGLYEVRDKTFGKYSLDIKQKLTFGQAIMEDPKILMLDEPTNAIDDQGIIVLKDIVKKEREKAKIILIASHEKEIIDKLADEIFIMKEGSIVDHKIR